MNVSDAQNDLYHKFNARMQHALEDVLGEFQDKVVELAEEEFSVQPILDLLAREVGWDCFPNDATIALVASDGTVALIDRQTLEMICLRG